MARITKEIKISQQMEGEKSSLHMYVKIMDLV